MRNRGAAAVLILRWNRLTLLENNRALLISFRRHPVGARPIIGTDLAAIPLICVLRWAP